MSEACAVTRCTEGVSVRGVCSRHLSEAAAHRRKGKSWRRALALVGVPPEAAELLGAPLAGTEAPEEEDESVESEADDEAPEDEALRCETCGVAMTRGRGARPRWCAEHRVEGRRAAAAARLKARVAPATAPEVDEEPAPEEPATDAEPSQDEAEEVEEAAPSPSEEELPALVERLRRALPRQARDAFVAGYLLGRGGP